MGYRQIVMCSSLCKEGFGTYNSIHSSRQSTTYTKGLQLSLDDTEELTEFSPRSFWFARATTYGQ